MGKEDSTLTKHLRQRAGRVIAVRTLYAYLAALVLVLFGFYFLFGIAYFLPQVLLFNLNLTTIISTIIFLPIAVGLITFWAQWRDTTRLTLTLEQHYPHLRHRLLTALEFAENPERAAWNPVSRLFAKGLEEEVNSILARCGFKKAASFKELTMPVLVVLGILFWLGIHALIQPDFFSVAYERLSSRVTRLASIEEMRLEREQLPSFEIQVTPGNCEVAKGTNLKIQTKISNYDARRVELFVRSKHNTMWQRFSMKEVDKNQFQFLLTHILEPISYFVKADHQESEVYQVDLYEPLSLDQAVWEIEFPEYLATPVQKKVGWPQRLPIPEESVVTLTVDMNRPVYRAFLLVNGRDRLAFERDSTNKKLTAHFKCWGDMVLTLGIQDETGDVLGDVPPLLIQAIPDLSPSVEVLEPKLHNYVYPTEEIPFQITVNDDYGIESIDLVLRYHWKEKRIPLLEGGEKKKDVKLDFFVEFEDLRLKAGEILFAYVEARDANPDSTHLVKSPLMTFLIRQYWEGFTLSEQNTALFILRQLMDNVLIEQEEITQDTWDLLSMPPMEYSQTLEEES